VPQRTAAGVNNKAMELLPCIDGEVFRSKIKKIIILNCALGIKGFSVLLEKNTPSNF
jgi:hypothetical protein